MNTPNDKETIETKEEIKAITKQNKKTKTVQKLITGNDFERLQSAAETSIHKQN